jgi:hypothetical protein
VSLPLVNCSDPTAGPWKIKLSHVQNIPMILQCEEVDPDASVSIVDEKPLRLISNRHGAERRPIGNHRARQDGGVVASLPTGAQSTFSKRL